MLLPSVSCWLSHLAGAEALRLESDVHGGCVGAVLQSKGHELLTGYWLLRVTCLQVFGCVLCEASLT